MLIHLKDVPRDERHLLFCSRLLFAPRRSRRRRRVSHTAAINRSLKVHGDGVTRTWPAVVAVPIDPSANRRASASSAA